MKKTITAVAISFFALSATASAQTFPRLGKQGTSYDDVLANVGKKPTSEYTITAVEDLIDPFVGPQTAALKSQAEQRAGALEVPAIEARVVEWQDGEETIRAVFTEEGTLWYSTATTAGLTAGSIAEQLGAPRIATIVRYAGTAIQIFTVFAYPDRGSAWIGPGGTPPFIPNGTFPTPRLPNGVPSISPSIANTLPSSLGNVPLDEIPLVARITLPHDTLPGNLDGLVLEEPPQTFGEPTFDESSIEILDAPVKPEPTPKVVPTKKPLVKKTAQTTPVKKKTGGPWRSPLASTCITSGYGPRNTGINGASKLHLACDLRAGCGTQVKAARGGTVTWAQWTDGYGYQIRIDHGDGTSTRYSHLQKGGFKVKVDDTVDAGDLIALSGNTSSLNAKNKKPLACHLHFEVLVRGKKVNPTSYVSLAKCGGGRGSGAGRVNGGFIRP